MNLNNYRIREYSQNRVHNSIGHENISLHARRFKQLLDEYKLLGQHIAINRISNTQSWARTKDGILQRIQK